MAWIQEHRKGWRTAILGLLLVAVFGPWAFDRVIIPREYACSPTSIRLEGDFCGEPIPGAWILGLLLVFPIASVVNLILGATALADFWLEFSRGLLASLGLLVLVLPFFTTLRLVLRGGRPRVFHLLGWILAAGIGLWFGLTNYPDLFWKLWGIWLYFASTACALILELCVLVGERRTPVQNR